MSFHRDERQGKCVGWLSGIVQSAEDSAHRSIAPSQPPGRLMVKLGGSLLERADWPELVHHLVCHLAGRPLTIVVGGGAVVNGLRAIDQVARRPTLLMHSLAIDGMGLTARLVADALGLPFGGMQQLACDTTSRVLDVAAWIAHNQRCNALPSGWDVTSDSIAACAAVACGGELLLVKSVPPPPCTADRSPLECLAAAGWVDPFFPIAAATLTAIEWASPAPI
ncbi:MAG: hypothetical protein WCQ91_00120 [Planctomycetota bacterium]